MRKTFEQQLQLGDLLIEDVIIPKKTRSHLAALAKALKYIYVHHQWNSRIFELISGKLSESQLNKGRAGMDLWEIFVLAQVRLCMNISYDELHFMANDSELVRGIMGVLRTDFKTGKQYSYQGIYDNVTLLDDELLTQINDVILEMGHQVFKKKGNTPKEATASTSPTLRCKTDSFVVETDTHFPTDYNLLWDSARKCVDIAEKLATKADDAGWRKAREWRRILKGQMRTISGITGKGGKNKTERLQKATTAYLTKARALEKKVTHTLNNISGCSPALVASWLELTYYHQMLVKHIDLMDRRILQGEVIPHEEKLFSIFQPYTEWINKGKKNPSVEIGKRLVVTSDQFDLIVDWQIGENQTDNQLTLPVADRLMSKYRLQSLSFDRGFYDKEDKEILETEIPEVIMPKKGKRSEQEKQLEEAPSFVRQKNKHNAIESNINELEHRGLNRCPDRSRSGFNRYIGLAVTAYNLHKIGRELQKQEKKLAQRQAKSEPVGMAA